MIRQLNSANMIGRTRDAILRRFDYGNIYYDARNSVIYVVVYIQQGRRWVPCGGGPLYGQSAIDSAKWLAKHIEEFRDLLPKDARKATIKTAVCYSENGVVVPTETFV